MKVYVIVGRNGMIEMYGCAGVGISRKVAEEYAKTQDLDEYIITEHEVQGERMEVTG